MFVAQLLCSNLGTPACSQDEELVAISRRMFENKATPTSQSPTRDQQDGHATNPGIQVPRPITPMASGLRAPRSLSAWYRKHPAPIAALPASQTCHDHTESPSRWSGSASRTRTSGRAPRRCLWKAQADSENGSHRCHFRIDFQPRQGTDSFCSREAQRVMAVINSSLKAPSYSREATKMCGRAAGPPTSSRCQTFTCSSWMSHFFKAS